MSHTQTHRHLDSLGSCRSQLNHFRTFPKPCFKQLNTDGIELNQTDAALVIKAGTAVWARIYNGNGDAVADFAVGTEITLAQPNLALGSTLMINSFVLKPTT